uniref:Ig-like domain-containing protein n=1 Tax=Stegastes partitus TaxID=144197 RepID=A0A3B5AAG2_9TELE
MRAAAMSLAATTSGFLVLLLTVTVMHSLGDWGVTYTSPHICAVKGSTVEIRCTYTYPLRKHDRETTVEKTLWFSKQSNDIYVDLRTDPDYSGRVDYRCGNNDCILRITDLRKSDSAVYMFRFITNHQRGTYTGLPGVTLFVADLQVSRSPIRDSRSVELKCQSSCPLPDHQPYVWYSNGRIIEGQTSQSYLSHFDSLNKISCAVSGHEKSTSPSVLVKAPWDVTYTSTQICAFEGSTVEMHCSYTYPPRIRVAETFWFTKMKDNQFVELKADQDYHGRVEYSKKSCSLTIKSLKKTDSAEYKFRFITNQELGKYTGEPGVTLSVSDPQLQIRVRRSTVNQFSTWTELTCHSNCQHADYPSYVWYKNRIRVEEKKRYLHLQTFDPSDTYYCAVKEQERFHSPAVYAPKPPSVSVSPSADIVEGRSVTL